MSSGRPRLKRCTCCRPVRRPEAPTVQKLSVTRLLFLRGFSRGLGREPGCPGLRGQADLARRSGLAQPEPRTLRAAALRTASAAPLRAFLS